MAAVSSSPPVAFENFNALMTHSTPELGWAHRIESEEMQEEEEINATLKLWEMIDAGSKTELATPVLQGTSIPPQTSGSPPRIYKDLRLKQREFVQAVGKALYKNPLPALLPWFSGLLIDVLREPAFARQVSKLLAPTSVEATPLANSPPVRTRLLSLGMSNQVLANVRAVQDTLQETLGCPELREEFVDLLMKVLSNKLDPSLQKIVSLALNLYGPETLLAMTISIAKQLEAKSEAPLMKEFVAELQKEHCHKPQEQLLLFLKILLEKGIPEPLEAFLNTFFERLFDEKISGPLFEELRETLLALFFPDPVPVSSSLKKMLLQVLGSVAAFFHALNEKAANLANLKLSDDQKRKMLLQSMEQMLCTKGILSSIPKEEKVVNVLAHVLKTQIEQLLALKLQGPHTSLVQTFLTPLLMKLIFKLFTPTTLHILIHNFLRHPMSLYNPFEAEPKKSATFDAADKTFSKELETTITSLRNGLIGFASSSTVLQKVAEVAMDLFLPVKGDETQDKLNRLFKSGTRLLPVITAAQVCFVMPSLEIHAPTKQIKKEDLDEELRKRFHAGLAEGSPALDFAKLVHAKPKDLAAIQVHVEQSLLGTEKQTAKMLALLKQALPLPLGLGSGAALEILQKFYLIATEENFLKIFLAHVLEGVKKGLIPSEKNGGEQRQN